MQIEKSHPQVQIDNWMQIDNSVQMENWVQIQKSSKCKWKNANRFLIPIYIICQIFQKVCKQIVTFWASTAPGVSRKNGRKSSENTVFWLPSTRAYHAFL